MAIPIEENLLELDPPLDGGHINRIHFFARVLAYGALADQWSPYFVVSPVEDSETRQIVGQRWGATGHINYSRRFNQYLKEKWNYQHPQASFLDSFGYLEHQRNDNLGTHYKLTPRAFALLERPAIPPKVFISYCHRTSSAFALMLEYRLQVDGIPVFIDRSIPSGDEWHARLQSTVQNCQYFVCLVTPAALESEFVRKEIQWAERQLRIPIWQPGFALSQPLETYPVWLYEFVSGRQAIRVLEESAEAYHDAVEKLRHELGFAPL